MSGLSTGWRPTDGRVGVSMFLLERIDDVWQPWTPPVRGCYDSYGAIELWPEDITPETLWIGERFEWLLSTGALTTSWPDDLTDARARKATPVQRFLHHGAETVYNGVDLRIDGAPVAACIVLERVVDAIASVGRGSNHDPDAWFPAAGAGRRHFAALPQSARGQLGRHAAVLAYAQARGGLQPIASDRLGQHSAAEQKAFAREAWDREDGPLRKLIDRCAPRWTAPWRRAADEAASTADHTRALADAAAPRTYHPSETYAVGEVLEHPSFGLGRVESLQEVNKICVRFRTGERVMVHRRAP